MKTCRFVLLLLGLCGAAHADRDIVYSARYYAPTGSHKTSHFHIYRINSDGTGKTQLTFGTGEDYAPRWSADGRQITFIAYRAASPAPLLCTMAAGGQGLRVLKALGENGLRPDPPTPGYRLDNDETNRNSATEKHILISLTTERRLTLLVPADDDGNDALLPAPGRKLVYAANLHNSTVGTDFLFYRLNPDTGVLRRLTEGQFLAWSADGSRFCTAPGRDTTPYEKRKMPFAVRPGASAEEQSDDKYRTVWFAPLYVRAASGGKMRQLTPRLSYVTGADWRREK